MPVIGYQYLLNVRYGQPQAFHVLMLGQRSWLFDLVALLYGLLVVVGSTYIASIVFHTASDETSGRMVIPVSLVLLGLAAIVLAQPYHIQHIPFASLLTNREINPFGKMQPHKYYAIAFLVLFGLLNWLYFLRWFPGVPRHDREHLRGRDRKESYLLISLALVSVLIMLSMGWVRESARAVDGYLIYGHMSFSDERPTYTAPP
jgi:hypothetical protein